MNPSRWRCWALMLVGHLVVVLPLAAQPTMACADGANCRPTRSPAHGCCAVPPQAGGGRAIVEYHSTCVVVAGRMVDLVRQTPQGSFQAALLADAAVAAPLACTARLVSPFKTIWSPLRLFTTAVSPRAPPAGRFMTAVFV